MVLRFKNIRHNLSLVPFAFCFFICFPSLSSAVSNITKYCMGEEFKWGTYAMYALYFIIMALVFFSHIKLISIGNFMVEVFLGMALLFTMATYDISSFIWTNAYDIVGNPLYQFLFYGLLGLPLIRLQKDINQLLEIMDKFAPLAIFLAIIQYVLSISSSSVPQYMDFSYDLLPVVIYVTLRMLYFKDFKRVLFSILGIVLILIAGCRGALICLLSAIIIYIVLLNPKKSAKTYIFYNMLFIMSIGVTIFWNDILSVIGKTLQNLNISSRTINLLIENAFFYDSGRLQIWYTIKNSVGLLPNGLYYDRIVTGYYTHNIFLELIVDFGYILGFVIIAWLVYMIFSFFLRVRNDYNRALLFCWLFSAGFMKLMFSGSYLGMQPCFYLFLGLIINFRRNIGKNNCTQLNTNDT